MYSFLVNIELIVPLVFNVIRDRQLRLLFDDPDVRQKCKAWLTKIKMPISQLPLLPFPMPELPASRFNGSVAIHQNNSAIQSSPLDIALSALSINTPRTKSYGQPKQTTPTGKSQVQKQSIAAQAGVTQDKQPEKIIVLNQVGNPGNNTARISTGNSSEPGIRQKAMEYLHGHKEDLTVKDMKAAIKECPDLKDALMAGMEGGEPSKEHSTDVAPTATTSADSIQRSGDQSNVTQLNPSRVTAPTPASPSTNSTVAFTRAPGGSENTTVGSDQTVSEAKAATSRHIWVPPHLRGVPPHLRGHRF